MLEGDDRRGNFVWSFLSHVMAAVDTATNDTWCPRSPDRKWITIQFFQVIALRPQKTCRTHDRLSGFPVSKIMSLVDTKACSVIFDHRMNHLRFRVATR